MRLKKIVIVVQLFLLMLLESGLLAGCSSGPRLDAIGLEENETQETESGMTGGGAGGAENPGGETEAPETEARIAVYVCGAVNSPGVYELEASARVFQAVEAAGGFRDDADQEWVNQAQFLQDGGKIRIYTRQETEQMRQAGMEEGSLLPQDQAGEAQTEGQGLVNLNTATKEELMTLPGIGEAKAEAVIAYRQEQGGFSSIEDIMNISGIKEAVFSKIKDRITV